MVGNHAQPDVVVMVGAITPARHLRSLLDDGEDLVNLVHVVDALEQVRDALQTSAGVNVEAAQRAGDVEVFLGANRGQILGLEHEVPDLEVTILIGLRTSVGAVSRTTVDVDLGARAARTGDAHVPVVVLKGTALDVLIGHPDGSPGLARLDVALGVVGMESRAEDRHPDAGRVKAESTLVGRFGDELPGVLDGLILEVVTEGEVAQHLEEGAVAGGLADLVDIEGTDALLDAGGAFPRGRLGAHEVGLERHHAGIDEQQRGVVVQQRGARHHCVTLVLEEVDEALSDLRCSHAWSFLTWSLIVACGKS